MRGYATIAGMAAAVLMSACGSGARQDAKEPKGNFPIQASARWISSQHLAQHTELVITAKNTGRKTVPNVAVTICNVSCSYSQRALQNGQGSSVQAFSYKLNMPGLANASRPAWIIDQAPGPQGGTCPQLNSQGTANGAYDNNYSACTGGPGGAVSAYSNTWSLGSLAPGHTAKFAWNLTAVQAGSYQVHWQVTAGLNGKAKAVIAPGSSVTPEGSFAVKISQSPQQAYVDNNGQVVTSH